jgi:hypothetical protein
MNPLGSSRYNDTFLHMCMISQSPDMNMLWDFYFFVILTVGMFKYTWATLISPKGKHPLSLRSRPQAAICPQGKHPYFPFGETGLAPFGAWGWRNDGLCRCAPGRKRLGFVGLRPTLSPKGSTFPSLGAKAPNKSKGAGG